MSTDPVTKRRPHPETLAVSAGRPPAEPDAPLNVAPTFASTYTAGGDLEYGRFGNPTWSAFEEALGALEGGSCRVFASGLAATAAVLDQVPTGGTVVALEHSYLGTHTQLARLEERGLLRRVLVGAHDHEAILAAIRPASMVWIESPTNPALEVVDIAGIARAAHAAGATLVVDNTFATPILQQPLDLGADIVVHSATKFISGHSDVVLGAVISRDVDVLAAVTGYRTIQGATPGPMEVFLALRGLRTLALRVERAQSNAQQIVARLADHAALADIRYPGFGAIVSLVLPDAASADRFVAGVRLARHATSLGGVETTLERRRRWPGEAPTIPEGLVRVSVGIEHIDDLFDDLNAALTS
ncbi:MAG: PLP-dependent transferase [Actinomycetota bacterium]|nr:PLP-dependent transferase [Actinomycetota bacterium]